MKLRIAQIAPLWERVPPPKYGGIEMGVSLLTEGLVRKGHSVTLFAAGTSKTKAKLVSVYKKPLYRAGIPWTNISYPYLNLMTAFLNASEYDIIHIHLCLLQDYLALPLPRLLKTKILFTTRSVLPTDKKSETYTLLRNFPNNNFVSISNAQRKGWEHLNWIRTIYNGIDVTQFAFNPSPKNHLVWVGKIRPEKGVHLAIKAALETNQRLILAGPIDMKHPIRKEYYEKEVKPLIDGSQIVYVGELTRKAVARLFCKAKAFINPIIWPEAFGLVMAESQVCGTPVIVFNRGSAKEVVKHGKTGFVANTFKDFCRAIYEIESIDRRDCREWALNNFSHQRMISDYESLYHSLLQT